MLKRFPKGEREHRLSPYLLTIEIRNVKQTKQPKTPGMYVEKRDVVE